MSSRLLCVAVLAVVMVTVGGCSSHGSDDGPSQSQAGSQETPSTRITSPTPTPSPPSSSERIVIPDCSGLMSIEQVRVAVNDDRVQGPDPLDVIEAPNVLGPAAQELFRSATELVGCTYGIPQTDGGFYVIVVAVESPAASEVVAALAVSDEYAHTTRGEVEMFSKDVPEGIGTHLGYAFAGGAWAIVQGTMVGPETSVNVAADAVTAVLE
ncbi:hypothetical protein [Microbacterium sp. Yaish 1]|uniref:hypothetical protein n=1 Tax=Microbacterium sp. Yaish 1 TaxID=2025014 RepID=UPI00117C337D|nr:hypothetical protein [Microbacterium sp. Yaish 1]